MRRWRPVAVLLELAKLGALKETVKISTEELAKRLGVSQQTASRYLLSLERAGMIERVPTPRGSIVRIAKQGEVKLRELHHELSLLFEGPLVLSLEGVVFTGLKEGAYYVSREGYRRQFVDKLGFEPFPGTLNLRLVSERDLDIRRWIEAMPFIEIEGFSDEERSFGPAKCYPALIQGRVRGAIVMALRTHYGEDVVELIAPVDLRRELNLKDGDRVRVEVSTPPQRSSS